MPKRYIFTSCVMCGVLGIFALFSISIAEAAPREPIFDRASEPYEQRLREREEQQRRSLLTPPPLVETPPPSLDIRKEAGACIPIQRIRVEGSTLLSESTLARIVRKYEGQCLSLEEINGILQVLTNAYVERGYVTSRAVLGPQDLSQGELLIRIVEGKVDRLEMTPASTMNTRQLMTIFPRMEGSILQLRDIEQGLDQLNRLPSNNASMQIAPGETSGGSKVVISNEQARTWRLIAGADNLGQETTGLTEYTLGIEKDNFIGINDQVSLYWTAAMPPMAGQFDNPWDGYSDSMTALFSIPYGYWLVSGSLSRFTYTTQLYGMQQAYTSSGATTAARLALDRVLWRGTNGKFSAGVFYQYRDVENSMEDIVLLASSYRLSSAGLALSYVQRLWGGVLTLQAEQSWGLPGLSKSIPGPITAETPHTEFSKTSGSINWYRPFILGTQDFTWTLAARGQTSQQTLYGSERLYLGSVYTVRGFRGTPVGGDCGGYVRNEIAWNLPQAWLTSLPEKTIGPIQLFGAYDYGGIATDSRDPYERGDVQGMALGLRTQGDLNLEVAWSHPLGAPAFVKERDDVWYINFRYTF